jgi:hypothetical protein
VAVNISESPGQRVLSGTVDELRAHLPPAEIAELEKMAAEVQDATSSPQKLRRWERKAAREAAEQRALEIAYHRLRSGRP